MVLIRMAAKLPVGVAFLGILTAYVLVMLWNTPSMQSLVCLHLIPLLDRGISWVEKTFIPPQIWLTQEITSLATAKAIYLACELKLPDILSQGPLSAQEIAHLAKSDPENIERVLKFLTLQGLFYRNTAGKYQNTQISEYLREDSPSSQRSLCMHLGYELTLPYQEQLSSLYSPSSPSLAFSDSYLWDSAVDHELNSAMLSISQATLPSLVQDFPWFRYNNAVIVDVGGGVAEVTASVLQANLRFKAIIYDQNRGIDHAKAVLSAHFPGISKRISLVKGSLFSTPPTGGDIYTLSSVLHHYNDKDAVRILESVATALNRTQQTTENQPTLLIMEHIYDYSPEIVSFLDMLMFSFKGKERTLKEFEEMLQKVGLKLVQVHYTRSLVVILECQLA